LQNKRVIGKFDFGFGVNVALHNSNYSGWKGEVKGIGEIFIAAHHLILGGRRQDWTGHVKMFHNQSSRRPHRAVKPNPKRS
jgi:hypothetical protein